MFSLKVYQLVLIQTVDLSYSKMTITAIHCVYAQTSRYLTNSVSKLYFSELRMFKLFHTAGKILTFQNLSIEYYF